MLMYLSNTSNVLLNQIIRLVSIKIYVITKHSTRFMNCVADKKNNKNIK